MASTHILCIKTLLIHSYVYMVLKFLTLAILVSVITMVSNISIISMFTMVNMLSTVIMVTVISVAVLVSPSHHRFMYLWSCYYQLQEIEKYKFRVGSNGIMFLSKFIKIHPAFLELKYLDIVTDITIHTEVTFLYTVQTTHKNDTVQEETGFL
jgi:hypothetical protein